MSLPSIIFGLGMGAGHVVTSPHTHSAGAAVTDHFGAEPNAFPDWVDESNVTDSDDTYCTCTFPSSGSGTDSEWLFVDEFGFDIPAGATIDGIQVDIECKVDNTTGTPVFEEVILRKQGSATGVSNLASADPWSTTEQVLSYGGATELWGTTWTVANINHADTGVRLFVSRGASGGSTVFSIDHIAMTVWFTEGGASNRRRRLLLAS